VEIDSLSEGRETRTFTVQIRKNRQFRGNIRFEVEESEGLGLVFRASIRMGKGARSNERIWPVRGSVTYGKVIRLSDVMRVLGEGPFHERGCLHGGKEASSRLWQMQSDQSLWGLGEQLDGGLADREAEGENEWI